MSIRELITPETVTLDLKAERPEEAMAELGALLVRSGAVSDLDAYLEAVKAARPRAPRRWASAWRFPTGRAAP